MDLLGLGTRRPFDFVSTRRGAALLLAILVLLHVALNILWLRLDNHVIRIDEEFHAMGAQNYYFALTNPATPGWDERWQALKAIQSPYPPLLHMLGAGLALCLGYSPDVVALGGTVCFALLLVGVYRLARQFLPRADALVTAVVCSLIPILFAGARYVALENLVAMLVVWGLYFLLRADGFRKLSAVAAFGILNGLVILTKPNGFVYYLLPAVLLFLGGVWHAVRGNAWKSALPILRNAAISMALTLLIAVPWYAANWDLFSQYWMNEHKGGRTPFAFAKVDKPSRAALPSTPITELANAKATEKVAVPAPVRHWDFGLRNTLRSREWGAYAIYMVNNGAFLPLCLIGTAGLLLGLWRYRRSRPFWMIVAWLVGSYLLNTLLFRFVNARYTMPFIPVLAIGTAILLSSVPNAPLRRSIGAAIIALLALQYANVSFLGDFRASTWIPILKDNYRVVRARDAGLTVTNAQVITGTYCFRAPVKGENYVERAFRAMRDKASAKASNAGTPGAYVLLESENNFGGFGFLRRTYAPEPNPLLRAELRGNQAQQQEFVAIGRYLKPTEAVAASDDADFMIVVMTQTNETLAWGPNHPYMEAVLHHAPFGVIDYFYTPSFGILPAAIVAVLERRVPGVDIAPGGLFNGYDAPELAGLFQAEGAAFQMLNAQLLPANNTETSINADLSHLAFAVRRNSEFLVQVRAAFRCVAPVEHPYAFVFEFGGMPGGPVAYPMEPFTPLAAWVPGGIYFVDCYLQVPPGTYHVRLHVQDGPGSRSERIIDMGQAAM